MYAIIEDGSRQYKVRENERLEVDIRDLDPGTTTVEFDRVLLIGDERAEGKTQIGQPWIAGAKVTARVDGQYLEDKIVIMKAKRRKGYRLKQGHRQKKMAVTIQKIHG